MDQLNQKVMMNNCPSCGGINIGRLHKNSYFCRDCCVELTITSKNDIYVHMHSEDGAIIRKIKVG